MNLKSAVRSPCISAVCSTSLFVPRWAGLGRMVLAVPGGGWHIWRAWGGAAWGRQELGSVGSPSCAPLLVCTFLTEVDPCVAPQC